MTTTSVKYAADQFLRCRRIAVTGVSRASSGHGSNSVYQRLRERGYEVFAVNPNAQTVEGDPTYPDLAAIPGGVEAVVIATKPERALETMHQVVDLGIKHVWMHRSFGEGSVCPQAAAFGREHGVRVIEGGCPLMFGPTADTAHKVMCSLLTMAGKVPRQVPE